MGFSNAVVKSMENIIGKPTDDDLERAKQEMREIPNFYISQNAGVEALQVKILSLKYVSQRKGLPQTKAPEMTVRQRQCEVSRRLRGNLSIYAKVSLEQSYETEIIEYIRKKFIPSGKKSLLLLGTTGCGKTHGAIAYVSSVASFIGAEKVNAEFVTAQEFAIFAASNTVASRETLNYFNRVPILVIDDLGSEVNGGFDAQKFLASFQDLIRERHEKQRATIITSNMTLQEFIRVYGERVSSRLREVGLVFESSDGDLRKETK